MLGAEACDGWTATTCWAVHIDDQPGMAGWLVGSRLRRRHTGHHTVIVGTGLTRPDSLALCQLCHRGAAQPSPAPHRFCMCALECMSWWAGLRSHNLADLHSAGAEPEPISS